MKWLLKFKLLLFQGEEWLLIWYGLYSAWSISGQERLPVAAGIGSRGDSSMDAHQRVIAHRWKNLWSLNFPLKLRFLAWKFYLEDLEIKSEKWKQNMVSVSDKLIWPQTTQTQWVVVSYPMKRKTKIIYSWTAVFLRLYCLDQIWTLELSSFIFALWCCGWLDWWRIQIFINS